MKEKKGDPCPNQRPHTTEPAAALMAGASIASSSAAFGDGWYSHGNNAMAQYRTVRQRGVHTRTPRHADADAARPQQQRHGFI